MLWTGISGWKDQQLPDGTVEFTSPSQYAMITLGARRAKNREGSRAMSFPGDRCELPLAEPVAKIGLLIAMRPVDPPVAAVPDIEALPIQVHK